jgi:hypothetical protein
VEANEGQKTIGKKRSVRQETIAIASRMVAKREADEIYCYCKYKTKIDQEQ